MWSKTFLYSLFLVALCAAFPAFADGIPQIGQIGMQPPSSPVQEKLFNLHNMLLIVITIITAFVTILLAYVCIRFRASKNPVPSKVTHHTMLEIVWTAIPIIILVALSIPSLRILYYMDKAQDADMTLKVVGRQWYWSYEYPEYGIKFDSNLIEDDKAKAEGKIRLLDVDNEVIVPVGATIQVLVTGADVIHNWFIPSLGVNKAANPGKANETWFKVTKAGVYYGQCAQLCGVRHGFMPIVVRALEKKDFDKWVAEAKVKFASNDSGGIKLAELSVQPQADNK